MNKKRIRQMDLALRRRLADRPAADCLAGHDELLRGGQLTFELQNKR
mgnify:CR=1 FL=1